ncbi:MAG TPA: hypothetical protein VK631_13080, partial [Solirubrobacteraceae bacterium]|nr:hypothetical protein [Solirubrobacteraceae bacterium]
MAAPEYGLRAGARDDASRAALLARHETVGLDGLLARRGRGGRRVPVPAPAAQEGFRWGFWDGRTPVWWPQGIDVRRDGSGHTIVVSWYAQRKGLGVATRLSFVRLRPGRRPRYQHVLLVEADADGTMRPIAVHAGGIAWHGDRVYVADTFGGIRLFLVDDIAKVRRDGWRRPRGAQGYRYVLPQEAALDAITPDGERRMRYSFVSLEEGAEAPQLVVGEYRDGDDGRLARLPLDPGEAGSTLVFHAPAPRRMQGACVVDGTWFITTSAGTR